MWTGCSNRLQRVLCHLRRGLDQGVENGLNCFGRLLGLKKVELSIDLDGFETLLGVDGGTRVFENSPSGLDREFWVLFWIRNNEPDYLVGFVNEVDLVTQKWTS